MFELVFLGTSASAPSVHRGLPSLAVLAGEHRYLVDCGEGTQRQILKSGIGYKKMNRVLLTHAHLDHILGLGGLISTFAHFESVEFVEIFGGKPALDRVESLLYSVVLREERAPMPIHLIDIKTTKHLNSAREFSISSSDLYPILDARQYEVFAFPVQHRGPGNFGFDFRERTHRPFLVEKAEALGIPSGPERGQLVKGHPISLADGRTIQPVDVLGTEVPGTKLVIMADVGRVDTLVEQCRDADTLVIEATFLDEHAEEARSFGHITARMAADLAVKANVNSLILWHVRHRYRERDILAEARSVFPNAYVARDFDHFVLKRGEGAVKVEPLKADGDETDA